MNNITVDQRKFNFTYLPEYAKFLLDSKLEEFVTVGIRFCREAELPLLRALAKYSERELVELSIDTNRQMLEALAANNVAQLIKENLNKYITNTMGYMDKEDLLAEDLTLGFHLRRKVFTYFLDSYTKNLVLHKLIISEMDAFTTQEELIAYSVLIKTQHEKMALHTDLLLETQKLAGIGSYYIDLTDQRRTFYTPEYLKILDCDGPLSYDELLSFIHPEDKSHFKSAVDEALKNGGEIDIEFRYLKGGKEKRLSDKGIIEMNSDGSPAIAKGSITDITERYHIIQKLKDTQTMYEKGQQLNKWGNWLWNLQSGKLLWSNEMYDIFEVSKDKEVTLGGFLSMVAPNDKESVKSALENPIHGDYNFDIITSSGKRKTIKGISRVERNEKNIIKYCYGTCQDVTALALAAAESEMA